MNETNMEHEQGNNKWQGAKFQKQQTVRISAEGLNKGQIGTVLNTWQDPMDIRKREYNIQTPEGVIIPVNEESLEATAQ